MSGSFQKKTSNYLVSILIGLIVISFILTGIGTMRGTPDTVAKVGDHAVKVREYNLEYQRQMEFYKSIFGGKDLTSEQIENFGIKKNALRNLIQRKLMLGFSDDLGVSPSADQIKDEIKKLPYFQTNNQFDINKYKALLSANRLTPTDFENDIAAQVKAQMTQEVLAKYPISDGYLKDIQKFKSNKVGAHLVQIDRSTLRSQIPVSNKEISAFLADETNLKRVENLFNERKTSLDQQEQVRARHILIKTDEKNEKQSLNKIQDIAKKVTPANFAKMANKFTEDPSGKGKGGDLKWFSRGRMVPEFEKVAFSQKVGTISKPVKSAFGYHLIYVEKKKPAMEAKLADHKNDLAKELIQKNKTTELDQLLEEVNKKVTDAFNNGTLKQVERLQKRYNFKMQKNTTINQFDGTTGSIMLEASDIKELFAKGNKVGTYSFKSATNNIIAHVFPSKGGEKTPTLEEERRGLNVVMSRKLSQSLTKALESDTSVKVYNVIR